MGAARSPAPILEPFEKEHIGGIRIRTTEACSAGRLAWKRAAVAQDVHIGEGHVHGHGAQLSPFRVKVEAVPHLVPPVAAAGTLPVDQCDPDSRPFHGYASS